MPKKVDHASRRTTIAQSVRQLAAKHGMEAVTMRNVAKHAGISLGQLQHYFTSKDELVDFAYDLVTEQVALRVTFRDDPNAEEDPGPQDVIRNALVEMLPLDEERTIDAGVWVAYLVRAAAQCEEKYLIRKTSELDLLEFVSHQLSEGQRDGTVPFDIDTQQEARTLLATVDGLILHTLIGFLTPADATQALDDHLDRLFSG